MMTFETSAHQGAAVIIEKLQSLPFIKVKHSVSTQDAQPSGEHGGIIVLITGALLVRSHIRVSYLDALSGSY
jgi:hypothetical protein